MFFLYVLNDDNDVCEIAISKYDQAACMNGNLDLIKSLVVGEGLVWETVKSVEVETGSDHDEDGYPDADNPDTQTCFIRGGI